MAGALKSLATVHVGRGKAIIAGTVFDPGDLPEEVGFDDAELNRLLDNGVLEESDEPLSAQTFRDVPTGPTSNPERGRPLTLPRGGSVVQAPAEPKAVVGTDGETKGPSAGRKPGDPRNSPT